MMAQLLAHLWGDYLLQSDWMAENKTKRDVPAAVHAFVYSLCFFPLLLFGHHREPGWALSIIFVTHFFIDRYRLARYLVWAKNFMAPRLSVVTQVQETAPGKAEALVDYLRYHPLAECPTGYWKEKPAWLAVWLLIIADNTLHLTINYLALRYL